MAGSKPSPTVVPFSQSGSLPLISYGMPYDEACRYHVDTTYNFSRVYLVVSSTLARTSDICDRFQQALGKKLVGTRLGMKPHTYWSEVLEIVNDARPLNIDCIITAGAGSLTDGAKVIAWALANDVTTTESLAMLADSKAPGYQHLKPPTVKHIAVPTTLSGGEYTPFAGATNDKTKAKVMFSPPGQNPALVILDPRLARTTPSRMFLGSGVRAFDHCVEALCSLQSNEEADAAAREGLRLLIPSLLRCKMDPTDLEATTQAQLGSADAIKPSLYGVKMGGSHAIGHQLGPLGVAHGETSCIMLPAVCKFNASRKANLERQQAVVQELLQFAEVKAIVPPETKDLASILDAFVRALGLPRTLKEVGVGRDQLETLAENTLTDAWAVTNPVPLVHKDDVLEILEMVAE
ncbi:hypothetical protein B0A52_01026 [Exophiala mesophila]|uniref:Uncharacterized protein n=1 Tax=Exophiala mesophila TaxID=212818 RepID=A0A438NG83_EXOME|nr:hypothetical protein B0A52_01026 [Exophiala mesophila]